MADATKTEDSGFKVTCLIGTGPVLRSWHPVLTALQATGHEVENEDAGNCVLARSVFLTRWAWSKTFRECGGTRTERDQITAGLRTIVQEICTEIEAAEGLGKLKTRPEFPKIVERFVEDHADGRAFVTTNWDGSVARTLRQIDTRYQVHHLHGRAGFGDLYLPSETADEPYRKTHRRRELTILHKGLKELIEGSARLVIYGLSLSPLDVEVSQMVKWGMESPSFREVVIIDPKHAIVAARLRAILPTGAAIQVTGYSPTDTRASRGENYSSRTFPVAR